MITIYNSHIPDELVIQYYTKLIGKHYAILPIFEGLDYKTKDILYDPFTAYDMFQKYLDKLIIEICGSNSIFLVNVHSIELLSMLRGIKDIDIEDHAQVKASVMTCIDLCKKIIRHLQESINNNQNDEKEGDDTNGL